MRLTQAVQVKSMRELSSVCWRRAVGKSEKRFFRSFGHKVKRLPHLIPKYCFNALANISQIVSRNPYIRTSTLRTTTDQIHHRYASTITSPMRSRPAATNLPDQIFHWLRCLAILPSKSQMPRRLPSPPSPLSTLTPLRILTQILTLQLLYYLCTTTLILFTALTAGKPFSPDLILSWRSLRGDTAVGWTLGLCWLGGSFCGYVYPSLHSPRISCADGTWKGYITIATNSALKTRPRLRTHAPPNPPDHRIVVLEIPADECAVVGAECRERGADDHGWGVELSVEGAEAD